MRREYSATTLLPRLVIRSGELDIELWEVHARTWKLVGKDVGIRNETFRSSEVEARKQFEGLVERRLYEQA